MSKRLKRRVASFLLSFYGLFSLFSPFSFLLSTPVYAQEVSETPAEVSTTQPETQPAESPASTVNSDETSTPPSEEVTVPSGEEVSTPPVPSAEETPATVVETSQQNAPIDQLLEDIETPEVEASAVLAPSLWEVTDGVATTTSAVVLNQTYQAPQNDTVAVTFTQLPDNPGTLTIKEVKLTAEQMAELGAFSDTAYEITSSMTDGTFSYNLTLPLPDSAKGKAIEVKSGETVDEITANAEVVHEPKEIKPETITITGLNHFTVFVLVNDLNNGGTVTTTDDIANGQLATIKDAWVNESSPTQNNGDATTLDVTSRDSSRNKRALIKFDTSSISATSTITKATLRLYMTSAPSNDRTYQLYRITSADWVEGDGGTNNNPAGEVRWDNQPTSSLAATTTAHTGTSNGVWIEFDVTSDVTAFLSGTANYGWLLKDSVESESSTVRTGTFRSRENGTQNQRPQLVVDFATSSTEPTQYNSPTAQAATTGGDGDGFEISATNAFADGGGFASNINGAGDRHVFSNYGFTIPTGATINGIEVRTDWYLDSESGVNSLSVELSHDNGTSWTSAKTDSTETTVEHIVSLGGASDTWGRTWSAADFSDSNFKVRVTSTSDSASRDFFLDWIPVRVYYTPDTTNPTDPADVHSTDHAVSTPSNDTTIDLAWTLYGSAPGATDAQSGVDGFSFDFTSGATGTPDTTKDGEEGLIGVTSGSLADGTWYFNLRTTDNAGNWTSTVHAGPFIIDTVAPTVAITSPISGDFVTGTKIITFTDDEYTAPECSIDNSTFVACTSGVTTLSDITGFDALADGNFTLYLKDTDLAGNPSTTNQPNIVKDTTAPATTDDVDGAWHNSNVTVHLTCDPGTGSLCDVIYWTTDGSDPTTASSTGNTIILTTDGVYTIKYFSKDAVGNTESIQIATNTVKIDKTNPTTPGTPTTTTPTNGTTPTWTWTASTDTNFDHYIFFWDTVLGGETYDSGNLSSNFFTHALALADGTWYGKVKAYDLASNTSAFSADGSAVIDTITPDEPVATPVAGDYSSDQSVTLSSADAASGLAAIFYTTDGSTPDNTSTLYSGAITVDHDLTLKAIAYDNAGNASTVLTAAYGIAPVISAETSSAVTSTSATITWTTDDPATSRVVYDTVSHPVLGVAPNYDYANSTVEDSTLVTSHSVGLTALTAGTTYYYRTVSHGSPETVSSEQTFATTAASSGDGGGGGGGAVLGAATAPVCSDTTPAAAPTLLSVTPGVNSALLTWSEGAGPLSYYLVAFGSTSGSLQYGNPNVGGAGTTSYLVQGLSTGTYYFRVRAGNGCKPGDFSNEIAVTVGGATLAGLPAGFAPAEQVLGVNTEEPAKVSAFSGAVEGATILAQTWRSWLPLLLLAQALLLLLFDLKLNRKWPQLRNIWYVSLTVLSVVLFMLLKDSSLVTLGSFMGLLYRFYWVAALGVAGLIHLITTPLR